MMRLVGVEMRRALHRRLVRVMIALAVVASVCAGVIVFFDSRGVDAELLRQRGEHHAALMADWWIAGTNEGVLAAGAFILVMGALVCGASVAGAEWRAGTITTVLTWEPRRARLQTARIASAGLLACAIGFVLEALFLAALVPGVVAHGSTVGVDGDWFVGLLGAMVRIALLTGLAAVVGCSLATLGRNTAAAIVAAWAWLAIAEGALRAWQPGSARVLLGESTTVVLGWSEIHGRQTSSPMVALLLVLAYCAAFSAMATFVFCRRDVHA
jgi:hypothetical protein